MDTISLKGMVSIAFLKKARFSGTFHSMRYMLLMEEKKIKAVVYPGPYCWESTEDDKKTAAIFAGSGEGLQAAEDWLNETYRSQFRNS